MKLADATTVPEIPTSHDGGPRKQVLLGAGVVPAVTQFARARFEPGSRAAPHSHPDLAELFWVASGKGTMVVGAEPVELLPGRFVCVEPGELHEVRADAGEPLELVYVSISTGTSNPFPGGEATSGNRGR